MFKAHRELLQEILGEAGVRIDGDAPHDIRVHDPRVYDRVFSGWSLGLGEAFMDEQRDCERLNELL